MGVFTIGFTGMHLLLSSHALPVNQLMSSRSCQQIHCRKLLAAHGSLRIWPHAHASQSPRKKSHGGPNRWNGIQMYRPEQTNDAVHMEDILRTAHFMLHQVCVQVALAVQPDTWQAHNRNIQCYGTFIPSFKRRLLLA